MTKYRVVINNEEFLITTCFGEHHAIQLAQEEWGKENHPITMECEELKEHNEKE